VSVQTIQLSGGRTEAKAVAENVARNQMEHIFNLAVVNQQKWDRSGPEKIIIMKRRQRTP